MSDSVTIEKCYVERLHEAAFALLLREFPKELSEADYIAFLKQCDVAVQAVKTFMKTKPLPEVRCL